MISQGIKDIAKQMIENPNDWVQGEYEFINRKNLDIKVWTSNGVLFINFRGNSGLNIFEKIYLNRAIKQSIANKLISNLTTL